MKEFDYELAAARKAQLDRIGGADLHGVGWYLVVGEEVAGQGGVDLAAVIAGVSTEWPFGQDCIATPTPDPASRYWLPKHGMFIEAGPTLVGRGRPPERLTQYCKALLEIRPGEAIDGVVLCLNASHIASLPEQALGPHFTHLRRILIEVNNALDSDVPVYVLVTGLDGLWGFDDTFMWSNERDNEAAFGIVFPPNDGPKEAIGRMPGLLRGLWARMESRVLRCLGSEQLIPIRQRALQHGTELADFFGRLEEALTVVMMDNAFERPPWIRALVLGSTQPMHPNGHVSAAASRHHVSRFGTLGYPAPTRLGAPTHGTLPYSQLTSHILLPERHIVPTRHRRRDDRGLLALVIASVLAWIVALLVWFL